MFLLARLTNMLPRTWRPRAKAAWPAIGTAVAVGVQWAATGELDRAELTTAITGIAAAIVTYSVPNHPR